MAEKVKLGICTSGSRLKLAADRGGRTFRSQRKVFNQERVLFGALRSLLGKAGGDLRSVETICAVRGPGRFTGIRISLTLAGALKAMAGAGVYTATLFEILALQAAESRHFRDWSVKFPVARLAALVHAFKDEYFCQFFRAGGALKLPRPEGEPVWLKAEELVKTLAAAGPLYVAADSEEDPGIYALAPVWAGRAPAVVSRVIPEYIIKTALAYKNGTLKPLYLKPARYELEQKSQVTSHKSPKASHRSQVASRR
ncbi:MAG: hypothetical protein COT18_13090 [Elusimicrobia bacterium CG08_land_8_20_14_0_20_59_10]|nr:MAG: hypothetical protein COT18_13090 [Elusimicrobia bacterium CG08_land_8_20_14_0_20_59_10]